MTPAPSQRLPALLLGSLTLSLWSCVVLSDDSGSASGALQYTSRKQSAVIYIGCNAQIAMVGAQRLQERRTALAKMTLQA